MILLIATTEIPLNLLSRSSFKKIILIIYSLLLSSCTCGPNKIPIIDQEEQGIKKIIQPDATKTKKVVKKRKKTANTTYSQLESPSHKVQVINVPIQRGIHFDVVQSSYIRATPTGLDPRVILRNTENNTIQSHSITNSLQVDTATFTPGGYDVYIIKQKNTNKPNLLLIRTGKKPTFKDTLISQPLWFILVTNNKSIRPFQDIGNGSCVHPVYPADADNSLITNTKLFLPSIQQKVIPFGRLVPRLTQHVSFVISGLAESNLPNNSFIDFFYSTRRIPLTPITRMWLISGLTQKQRYNLTFQVPTVKNYDPNKYLSYRTSPNLKNKFKFITFVKGWKLKHRDE